MLTSSIPFSKAPNPEDSLQITWKAKKAKKTRASRLSLGDLNMLQRLK